MISTRSQPRVTWFDVIKGVAIIGVVFEHWMTLVPHPAPNTLLGSLTRWSGYGGPLVHQFFLLSGWGLAYSHFTRGIDSWWHWSVRRFVKVIIPYWLIISATFLGLLLLHQVAPESFRHSFSWGTWLAHMTLARNFVPSSWSFNPSLWFIPVIVGLYACFPLLVKFLVRYGAARFMVLSFILNLGCFAAFFSAGYPLNHQASIFPFHILPFSTGIILAYAMDRHSFRIQQLNRWPICLLGLALVGLSVLLVQTVSWGSGVNDGLTAVGIFLILLFVIEWMERLRFQNCTQFLARLGKYSYTIYLFHWPLIKFGAVPFLRDEGGEVVSPLLLLLAEIASLPALLAIAVLLEKPLAMATSLEQLLISTRPTGKAKS